MQKVQKSADFLGKCEPVIKLEEWLSSCHEANFHTCNVVIHPLLFVLKEGSRFSYMLSLEALKVTSLRFFVEFKVVTFRWIKGSIWQNAHNLYVNSGGDFYLYMKISKATRMLW